MLEEIQAKSENDFGILRCWFSISQGIHKIKSIDCGLTWSFRDPCINSISNRIKTWNHGHLNIERKKFLLLIVKKQINEKTAIVINVIPIFEIATYILNFIGYISLRSIHIANEYIDPHEQLWIICIYRIFHFIHRTKHEKCIKYAI